MIEVVEYDESWPQRFEGLRDTYATALDSAEVPFVTIEHVGSTSVPGLAAKPVIDCDIVVERQHVEDACAVLIRLGFVALGELGIPQRGRGPTRTSSSTARCPCATTWPCATC